MPAVNKSAINGLAVLVFSLCCGIALAASLLIDQSLLDRVEKKYGAAAKQRFVDWQSLIENGKSWPEAEKLERVNNFFNGNVEFVDDIILWQKTDYWAAPTEFLAKGAGDCEDYSIAKYFTLVEMGVDESKLRITYVKALELNQAHMVLTYFDSPRAVPLVLDNLKPSIVPATQRIDLQPVYSFNGTGLWLAKSKGSGQHVGGSDRLSMWTELKLRMLESPF
ncbi:transglutaminase-like cysteine peptidase [Methylomonas sp. OY6]|uniref:Transglutaminase-like cysteine peptidase n=1 Tax=Methylomonas defluvii TaxID=3045149 RepID=A0ABU4ULR3_9GAMM|nr:transglutaminase-like cysteine peptidase [Methylomonas sp. OY6]MDX8130106.1 transglutaminase-like cysteine peptidase [Methylomonas sp. OY6]